MLLRSVTGQHMKQIQIHSLHPMWMMVEGCILVVYREDRRDFVALAVVGMLGAVPVVVFF